MDPLQMKAVEFAELCKFDHYYELEGGQVVRLVFRGANFPHLLGLHKLTDLPLIQRIGFHSRKGMSAMALFKEIQRGRLTLADAQRSSFYALIDLRVESFGSYSLGVLLHTDFMIDFDPKLIFTDLNKARFLLVQRYQDHYTHLALGEEPDGSGFFPLSYFVDSRDYYLRNQKCIRIVKSYRVRVS